ncbi:MAG: hypothetical protein ACOC1K_03945 [Nanoarchaeota archaeon]
MDVRIELIKLFKENFGDLGPSFLSRELKKLDITNLNFITDNQKDQLIDRLIKNIFTDFSIIKKRIIRSKLRSILNYSNTRQEQFNKSATIDYMLGRPI